MKDIVRSIPGIPLLLISHNSINLEKPSDASMSHSNQTIMSKLVPKENEMDKIKKLKNKIFNHDDKNLKRIHKKRKPKGPNPLSCKKKSKKTFPKNNN